MPLIALLYLEYLFDRRSLGIRLSQSVVIIDEAHNLVDAVNASHSACLTGEDTKVAISMITSYFDRFSSRLSPENSNNVQELRRAGKALREAIERAGDHRQIHSVDDFVCAAGLDNMNMCKLVRWAHESKLAFKASRYAESLLAQNPNTMGSACRLDAIHSLCSFVTTLTNDSEDGRIVVDPKGAVSGSDSCAGMLKFVLLNPAKQFEQVVQQAHAVVLASGTLSPTGLLVNQLFPRAAPESIRQFSCGHVIEANRLLVLAAAKGPGGVRLDFRHEQKGSQVMMDEAGRLLLNICTIVPEGVIAFVPSFAYAEQLRSRWSATESLGKLSSKTRVYWEPKAATEVERVLSQYRQSVVREGGRALLICVVGAKMSEGINFGDGLGRCVVVMGLPYPNAMDVELQERMRHIDAVSGAAVGIETASTGRTATGREYYNDLCMKAVNQSIGRVIRHRDDYAAIVLADHRYVGPRGPDGAAWPIRKLPGWIQRSLTSVEEFGAAYSKLFQFFKAFRLPAPAADYGGS
eukprot:evm.model.scf_201EXC.1 EVM.evm.TU.scf_201EXC.1   scf_201EXC:9634-13992(-)